MMCFLCMCVQHNIKIKANILGTLYRSKLNIPTVFKKIKKNKKKVTENGNFYAKLVFDQIDFFYMVVTVSQIHGCKKTRVSLRPLVGTQPKTIIIISIYNQ